MYIHTHAVQFKCNLVSLFVLHYGRYRKSVCTAFMSVHKSYACTFCQLMDKRGEQKTAWTKRRIGKCGFVIAVVVIVSSRESGRHGKLILYNTTGFPRTKN